MIFFEILGCLFMLSFFTFPLWIHNNWKVIIGPERKKLKNYLKEQKKLQFPKQKNIQYQKKMCSKQQPFKVDEKLSIICNFACDGNDCQFEDLEKWKNIL